MKLTYTQRNVLKLMFKQNALIHCSLSAANRMQIRCAGESLREPTFTALEKGGYIEPAERAHTRFGSDEFKLSDKGRYEADEEHQQMRNTFKRWLSDGESWIGCFENQDLSSGNCGHRFALCFDDKQWDAGIISKSRAPDHKDIGLGWRYTLKLKTREIETAVAYVTYQDKEPT